MNLPPINPSPSVPNNDTISKGECSNCGWKDRWLLHRVLVRGVDRRVCTSCVLRLYPSSFCPICFEFFEHPLSTTSSASAHRFMSCVKCSSLTHIQCLPSPPPPPSSFLCPPCSHPNFTFFPVPGSPIDKKLSLVLLCASKIASASMNKNLAVARARADRTVREAAAARKKAKEALEHFSVLHKLKRLEGSLEVSGSRNLELGTGTNNMVVSKKEDLNGFVGAQGKPLPQSQPHPQNGPVNKNGANGNPVIVAKDKPGNDGRVGNREQDSERVRSTNGTSTLNIK